MPQLAPVLIVAEIADLDTQSSTLTYAAKRWHYLRRQGTKALAASASREETEFLWEIKLKSLGTNPQEQQQSQGTKFLGLRPASSLYPVTPSCTA